MSIVSVSLFAFLPHFGQVVSINVLDVVIGERPTTEKSTSSGNRTGNWSSGTSCMPQSSQYTTGIGAPQYL